MSSLFTAIVCMGTLLQSPLWSFPILPSLFKVFVPSSSFKITFKANSEDHIEYPNGILLIEPVTINALHQIAIFMAREKMQVVQFASDISCMMSPAFSMVYIKELERLEENFHSLPCSFMQHVMLMAKYNESAVVAFVDMDRRREVLDPTQSVPYISDLIVSPHHRNKGIATALLQRCEHIANNVWKEKYLHLLAETHNLAAVSLYVRSGFVPMSLETGPMHCEDEDCVVETIDAVTLNELYSISTEDSDRRTVITFSEFFLNKLKLFHRVAFRKVL